MSKRRIQSLTAELSTLNTLWKIISASELQAISRLPGLRAQAEIIKEYLRQILVSVDSIANTGELRSYAQRTPEQGATYVFVISSSQGMSGSYNQEVYQALNRHMGAEDPHVPEDASYVTIGTKGANRLRAQGRDVVQVVDRDIASITIEDTARLISPAIRGIRAGQTARILVAYTAYLDAVNTEARVNQLFPLRLPEPQAPKPKAETPILDYEESVEAIVDQFIENYLIGQLYSMIHFSIAAEFVQRRYACHQTKKNLEDMMAAKRQQLKKAELEARTAELIDIINSQRALRNKRRKGAAA